jgi:hypothetical protein
MDERDLNDNQFVDLTAYYGEREDSLVKVFRGKFELNISSFGILTYLVIILGVIIVALIVVVIFLRRRDEEDDLDF